MIYEITTKTRKTQNYSCFKLNILKENDEKYYQPIPAELNEIGREIVDAAYKVHRTLGPGLLERVYEVCFCHELSKKGINYDRQKDILIEYDNIIFEEGLRLDVLVEEKVILS